MTDDSFNLAMERGEHVDPDEGRDNDNMFGPPPDPALDVDNAIVFLLRGHIGKMNAVPRETLRHEAELYVDKIDRLTDRAMRLAIARLRNTSRGCLILSSGGVSGYWLARDFQEVEEHYRYERRRSLSLMARVRKQRDLARAHFPPSEGQIGLFGYTDYDDDPVG